jgi:SNF2 family DNA or RNA helicase
LSILDKFSKISDDHSPLAMRRKKDLFKHMIALAACMRMALIHPVMPGGGRDVTINYSPTRKHLSRSLCNPKRCVFCKYNRPEKNFEGKKRRSQNDILENLGDDLLMDDDYSMEEDHIDDDKGELVEVPPEYCTLPNIKEGGLRHFVHEDCLDDVKYEGCPLCADLCSRAEMTTGKLELIESIKNAMSRVSPQVDAKPDPCASGKAKPDPCEPGKPDIIGPSKTTTPNLEHLSMTARPVYCADAAAGLGGFRSSAKIESIISDLRESLLAGDKVLMLSFFKASLDLLEGILHFELKVDYARFDGDFTGEERQKELDRFKQDKNCKVMLMTVQTGGTGLNIVEVG